MAVVIYEGGVLASEFANALTNFGLRAGATTTVYGTAKGIMDTVGGNLEMIQTAKNTLSTVKNTIGTVLPGNRSRAYESASSRSRASQRDIRKDTRSEMIEANRPFQTPSKTTRQPDTPAPKDITMREGVVVRTGPRYGDAYRGSWKYSSFNKKSKKRKRY